MDWRAVSQKPRGPARGRVHNYYTRVSFIDPETPPAVARRSRSSHCVPSELYSYCSYCCWIVKVAAPTHEMVTGVVVSFCDRTVSALIINCATSCCPSATKVMSSLSYCKLNDTPLNCSARSLTLVTPGGRVGRLIFIASASIRTPAQPCTIFCKNPPAPVMKLLCPAMQ